MAFCEGSVFGHDGKLCAHSTATFKYIKALPAGGRRLNTLQRTQPETESKDGNQ